MSKSTILLALWLGVLAQDTGSEPDSLYRQGIDAYNAGDYEASVRALEQAARRRPNVPDFRYHLGLAYLKAGRPAKAASEFEATLARTGMERATRLREPEVLAMAGVAYLRMGRVALARERVELALSRQENLPQAKYTLGLIELSEGDREQALAHFHGAVEGDPSNGDAHLALADILEEDGDLEHALEHLDLASGAFPSNLSIRLDYGRVALAAGSPEDAEAAFRSVLQHASSPDQPSVIDARFNLGTLLLERGVFDEAIQEMRLVLESSPERADARFNLAEALRRSGDLEGAKAALLRLLAADEDYAGAGFALALVHEGLDEPALAETRYRESIERRPDHVAAYLNLAALLERQRRGADAIEVLEACLALELEASRRQQLEDILDAMKATR